MALTATRRNQLIDIINEDGVISDEIFAEIVEYSLSSSLAKSKKCSPEQLALLARDEQQDVRGSVMENPNTSPELIELLANDSELLVRIAIMANPNASVSMIEKAAQEAKEQGVYEDKDFSIAHYATYLDAKLLSNPNVPEYLRKEVIESRLGRQRLFSDISGIILDDLLLENLKKISHFNKRISQPLEYFMTRFDVPLSYLEAFYSTTNDLFFKTIVSKAAATNEFLTKVSRVNGRLTHLTHILTNPNASKELIVELWDHYIKTFGKKNVHRDMFILNIIKHPNTPTYILEELSSISHHLDSLVDNPNSSELVLTNVLGRLDKMYGIPSELIIEGLVARKELSMVHIVEYALQELKDPSHQMHVIEMRKSLLSNEDRYEEFVTYMEEVEDIHLRDMPKTWVIGLLKWGFDE